MSKSIKHKIDKDILKRRFHYKKNPDFNPVSLSSPSKYATLEPTPYFDSDDWAVFEATFPEYAKDFYMASGADKYNHDALDLEIEKRYEDELNHYQDQYIRHIHLIKSYIKSGLEGEETVVREEIRRIDDRLEHLQDLLKAKQAIHGDCSKGGASK